MFAIEMRRSLGLGPTGLGQFGNGWCTSANFSNAAEYNFNCRKQGLPLHVWPFSSQRGRYCQASCGKGGDRILGSSSSAGKPGTSKMNVSLATSFDFAFFLPVVPCLLYPAMFHRREWPQAFFGCFIWRFSASVRTQGAPSISSALEPASHNI